MNYMNATTKTEAQIEALLAADDGGPVCMAVSDTHLTLPTT